MLSKAKHPFLPGSFALLRMTVQSFQTKKPACRYDAEGRVARSLTPFVDTIVICDLFTPTQFFIMIRVLGINNYSSYIY